LIQEFAYTPATAIAILDEVRPRVGDERMGAVFGRISFFVMRPSGSSRSTPSLRAMTAGLGADRARALRRARRRQVRLRYGVHVNALGLTYLQLENNVQRIVLEALAAMFGRSAPASDAHAYGR
jgi:(2R)-ethylmalonyl-CoA mutase